MEDLKTKISTAIDCPFVFMKDITKIDANAEILKPIGWQFTIFDGQYSLNLNTTLDRTQYTIALSRNVVAMRIGFPSMVFRIKSETI